MATKTKKVDQDKILKEITKEAEGLLGKVMQLFTKTVSYQKEVSKSTKKKTKKK